MKITNMKTSSLIVAFDLLLLGACLSMRPTPVAGAEPARPLRVLIVDGYNNHDWQRTTRLVRGIIEPTGLFEVSV